MLQRLAGLGPDRHVPWDTRVALAVFNPSPRTRTDIVRDPLDGFPLLGITWNDVDVHPLSLAAGTVTGYEVDGHPVRMVRSDDPDRVRLVEDWPAFMHAAMPAPGTCQFPCPGPSPSQPRP